MEIIDQLLTYIFVYVDNYQNNIYIKKFYEIVGAMNRIFANLRQEFNLPLASI